MARHLIGVSRDLQSRVMHSLSEERGYCGLRPSFGPFLSLVWEAGRPLTAIAGELAISKQACSQLANLAEAAGYLERRPNPADRRSKIVILDAKNKFSKQKLFEDGWAQYYPGLIEWVPLEITGGVQMVDVKAMTVKTTSETVKASVANIIPAQRAGRIAQAAGLADKSGWCPVEPATLASKLQPDIHLVGDAIIPGDMPKSGFSANSQAKACAMAVRVALTDAKGFPPRFRNTCWSLIATDDAVKVGASYKATEEKIAKTEGFISKAGEDDQIRMATAREAVAWYDGITKDIFG